MKVTYSRPPVEIFDVLHMAEEKGIELPESIDKWWERETRMLQSAREGE